MNSQRRPHPSTPITQLTAIITAAIAKLSSITIIIAPSLQIIIEHLPVSPPRAGFDRAR